MGFVDYNISIPWLSPESMARGPHNLPLYRYNSQTEICAEDTETVGNAIQGHHHNGDQAARRPHILCSICFHSSGALAKAVTIVHCITSHPANKGIWSIYVCCRFSSYLGSSKSVSVRFFIRPTRIRWQLPLKKLRQVAKIACCEKIPTSVRDWKWRKCIIRWISYLMWRRQLLPIEYRFELQLSSLQAFRLSHKVCWTFLKCHYARRKVILFSRMSSGIVQTHVSV